ncbi:MAG: serine/threonine-protein kinase [Cyanobacteria bacterium P01_F01_bin.86]
MIGQLIDNRYQVIEILGSGNMANTYLAEDLQTSDRSRCVVKRLVSNHPNPTLLEAKKQLFGKEAASLQALGYHDQIPRLFSYLENSQACYLVQEFVDGYPLTEEINRGDRWSACQVVRFLEDMLRLLMFVHERGVIHRDIKPSNIMRRHSDDQLVLVDFGAATQIDSQQSSFTRKTRTNFVVGTPGYMPIEQANGRAQPSSDVYALGMIAIQALTGIAPRQLQADNQGEWIWHEYAAISDELANILACMVRYQHTQRFQSAAAALAAVQALDLAAVTGDRPASKLPARLSSSATADSHRNVSGSDISGLEDADASTEVLLPFGALKGFKASLPLLALLQPLPVLLGAGAIVLATTLPGIANLMQSKHLAQQERQHFDPQNLQPVGLYQASLDPSSSAVQISYNPYANPF